jgi:hypothetical protein
MGRRRTRAVQARRASRRRVPRRLAPSANRKTRRAGQIPFALFRNRAGWIYQSRTPSSFACSDRRTGSGNRAGRKFEICIETDGYYLHRARSAASAWSKGARALRLLLHRRRTARPPASGTRIIAKMKRGARDCEHPCRSRTQLTLRSRSAASRCSASGRACRAAFSATSCAASGRSTFSRTTFRRLVRVRMMVMSMVVMARGHGLRCDRLSAIRRRLGIAGRLLHAARCRLGRRRSLLRLRRRRLCARGRLVSAVRRVDGALRRVRLARRTSCQQRKG